MGKTTSATGVDRIAKEDLDYLRGISVGTVYDALENLGLISTIDGLHQHSISRPTATRVVGPAYTVRYLPKGRMGKPRSYMYEVIHSAQPGDIVVAECAGFDDHVLGSNMATYGKVRGLEAFVIDGGTRDAEAIHAEGMPVFSRQSRVSRGEFELEIVDINVPIRCASAQVHPGDVLVGDNDGLAVIRKEAFSRVMGEVRRVQAVEEEQLATIRRNPHPKAIYEVLAKRHP